MIVGIVGVGVGVVGVVGVGVGVGLVSIGVATFAFICVGISLLFAILSNIVFTRSLIALFIAARDQVSNHDSICDLVK